MNNGKVTEKPILAALRELEIGESVTYPAERSSYLKSACSQFGFEWGKRFATSSWKRRVCLTPSGTRD